MELELQPGKYVVAVSGGVDSSALLHMLYAQNWAAAQRGQPTTRLVVAHFDHGIRDDASSDRQFVQALAKAYGLPFVYKEGQLGPTVSEAAARKARYEFLRQVQQASGSQAIITAHHQDDVLETAILNLLRGTGRKGLTALGSLQDIHRPILHIPKRELHRYATDRGLRWREDSTNQDQAHLRNYIRHRIMPRLDGDAREQLWQIVVNAQTINAELDRQLINQLHQQSASSVIDRVWFNHLPHSVAREVMATWLRARGLRQFDRKMLERLVVAAKVSQPGKLVAVYGGHDLHIGSKHLALLGHER